MALTIRQKDLFDNPTPRVPVCLVLDNSGSMDGDPISELNKGVRVFFEALMSDEVAQYSAEIAVVSFGQEVRIELDFEALQKQKIPTLIAWGQTPMGEAVNLSLDLLEKRKMEYKDAGVDYFQPWMVLMTDGKPTDEIETAVQRIRELVLKGKLTVFPIVVGEQAQASILQRFSPKRETLRLKGLHFDKFFEWLSQSVSRLSQSMPGETVKLDLSGVKGWADL